MTLSMSKTAEKVSEMPIPKFMRKKFFRAYARHYQVKLHEIVDPLDSFETFAAFFTRRVKPRNIDADPCHLISPADSKILKIAEIQEDECSIIKGASYSLGELLTGQKEKLTVEQIRKMKKNPGNKLYQVIFYLAPGDYHRFHCPADFLVSTREKIEGILLSVNERTLIKKKKVYEKNARVVLNGVWGSETEANFAMSMVMVGALNVGRIIVQDKEMFQRGEEIGYFNLGSTIVMIFEAPGVAEWMKREGEAVRYG